MHILAFILMFVIGSIDAAMKGDYALYMQTTKI